LQEYPGDEFLLVYDFDFKFGQNFFIVLSEESKERLLNVSMDFMCAVLAITNKNGKKEISLTYKCLLSTFM